MDIRSLTYFIAVFETGSFSAASKRQFVAQPSISASIKQLEATLTQDLFVRFPRGVKPTEAGEQLYPLAKQMVSQSLAIKNLFTEKASKLPFRLGLIKGLGVERMSKLLKAFTTNVEDMELTLVPPHEQNDARIISADMVQPKEKFMLMWQEEYRVIMPANHPLSLRENIDIEELSNLPFIQRSPCAGWNRLREVLQQHQVNLDIRASIRTTEYAIGLVQAGLGCAFIPVSSVLDRTQDVVARPLNQVKLNRDIGLAYQTNSPALEVLRRIV